jgi:hypothetical protein
LAAGGLVGAGAAVGAAQAVRIIEATTNRAIIVEIVFLFIFSS